MKRLLVVALLGFPLLVLGAGLYIILATPDVITQTIVVSHSHTTGTGLVGLGLIFVFGGGILSAMLLDD